MIPTIDVLKLKRRFGQFLSKAHHLCHISLDAMNAVLLQSNALDAFEQNSIEFFLDGSLEGFIEKVFGCRYLENDKEETGPVYWAGIQYMNILLNLRVPLKQAFIICPLPKMASFYEPYHEMDESRLLKEYEYLSEETSILKELMRREGMSIPQLSIASNLAKTTLRSYCLSNEKLFKASYDSLEAIRKALGVSSAYFQRQTDFLPFSETLLNDDAFKSNLAKALGQYFNADLEHLEIAFEKKEGNALILGAPNLIVSRKKRFVIEDRLLILLMQRAIAQAIENHEIYVNGLFF